MPHGFEYIVRPFASPGSLGTTKLPGTPKRTTEPARITWGGVGTMPAVKLLNPSEQVNVCHETATEQSRDAPVQRIVGSDGESYVDVARVEKMKLAKTEQMVRHEDLTTWQGFAVQKQDPRLAENPNFKQPSPVEPDKRCELGWSFKPSI